MTTYDQLFSNGCLIDLDIHEWRPTCRLRATDLGIPDTPAVRQALSLPSVRLMPREDLTEITRTSNLARKLVEDTSISFPIRGMKFVPYHTYPVLDSSLEDVRAKRDTAVESLQHKYSGARDAGLETARDAISDATGNDPLSVNRAMARLETRYPHPEDLPNLYRIRWTPISLSAPRYADVAEHVDECVGVMVQSLRHELSERIHHIHELLSSGGKLNGKSSGAARSLCQRMRSLNVLHDSGLDEAITSFEQLISQAESAGTNGSIKSELKWIQDDLEQTAMEAIEEAKAKLTVVGKRRILVP